MIKLVTRYQYQDWKKNSSTCTKYAGNELSRGRKRQGPITVFKPLAWNNKLLQRQKNVPMIKTQLSITDNGYCIVEFMVCRCICGQQDQHLTNSNCLLHLTEMVLLMAWYVGEYTFSCEHPPCLFNSQPCTPYHRAQFSSIWSFMLTVPLILITMVFKDVLEVQLWPSFFPHSTAQLT